MLSTVMLVLDGVWPVDSRIMFLGLDLGASVAGKLRLLQLGAGGAGKASRVTSLAAPLSFSALPVSETAAVGKSESPDGSDDTPKSGSAGPSDEQVEAEVICQRMDAHLAGKNVDAKVWME